MDDAKARALADKLTGAVTVDLYLHDDAEPHIEIVGAEEMILAFAGEARRETMQQIEVLLDALQMNHERDAIARQGDARAERLAAADAITRAIVAIRALTPQAALSKCLRCGQTVTNGRGCRDIRCPYGSVATALKRAEAS